VEKMIRKKLGRRILGVILSLVLMSGLMPEIPGSEMVVQAAGSEPGAAVYATKEQLMNDLGPAGDNTTVGRLVFGKNSSGEPLEWYILGKDTGVSEENTAIFTTSPIYGGICYYPREDMDSYNGGDATYANGFVPNWSWSSDRNVYNNHYCLSKVYKALQDMAKDTRYFTAGEQSLMQATTVTTRDIKNKCNYTTTDKLYLLTWENQDIDEKILAGTNANIIVPWGIYWEAGDAYFWLRSPYEYENYETLAGVVNPQTGEITSDLIYADEVEDKVVRPASNINLTNVLFASAATAASSDVATGTIPAGKAMVLRLDGSGKNMGSVVYDCASGVIIAKKAPEATGTVSLVVQGNDGTNDWYYSKVIGENTTLSETDIESALASSNIADVNLSDCKIWLETTGDDGLCYAINAEERTIVSTLEITDIVAPIAGVALDDEAACATAGVLDTTPSVTWKADGNEATGTAESDIIYTASVTLSLSEDFMWENTATATVNGKNATSITENNDNTVTITYEFSAAGKDRLVSITEPQSISVANGTTYDAMNLPDTVSIVTEGNTVTTANVVWDTENPVSGSYNPAILTEQTVTLSGTVTCPESIDANGVVLTTSITITISEINGCVQIANAEELYRFAEYVNAGHKDVDAELTADIDFSGWDFSSKPWTPICQTKSFHATATADTGYSGTFDGNGYTVSNLTVAFNSDTNNVYSHGLFGTVSGTVKNLGMVDFKYKNTTGDTRAGSVAGQLLTGGAITNCYSVGHSIKTNNNIAGGIAGCNYGGTISNCYALNGTVTGYETRWGGLVGDCQKDDGATDKATTYGTVSNCYTDDTRVVSTQSGNATITNCEVKAATAFTSGEVAYLLNGSTNGGTTWYQTLGNQGDSYPVLDSTHEKVYCGYDACKAVYANSDAGLTAEQGEHTWDEGVCSYCELVCAHDFQDIQCSICGKSTEITIKLKSGAAFDESEYSYNSDTKVHTINTTKEVTISGTTTTETIVVAKDVSANIIFAKVSIDVSAIANACAFKIEDNSTGNVTITLADDTENKLNSGSGCAGLQKSNSGGKLTICGGKKGNGSLEATGGKYGAGIGGGDSGAGTNITISGGVVTATGGNNGAGIGGGDSGDGTSITISGGVVTATGGGIWNGAGIGGGGVASGAYITISGGVVTAIGGPQSGAGIGGGSYYYNGTNITISGGVVTAIGRESGAGIGAGGPGGSCYYIYISGGSVKAIAEGEGKAIGGRHAVTPTLKDGTPVYLLEIANENNLDIVINDTDYPDKHFDESKIYAYLPAKTEAEPNGVTVGNSFTGYYYDTTVPEWKQATATNHTHEDTDSDCICDTCQYAYKHVDANKDRRCDVCETSLHGVTLKGSNLTLNGNIGLNLFFDIDEEVRTEILADETALIRFNLPDGSVREVPAKEGVEDTTTVVGTTLYKYPCELTAKQMTDRVKVQVVVAGEVIAEYEYSVADYAAVIIANAEGKYSDKAIALVKAMLNYGAYAQKNFGYNAENLANAQLAENEKSLSSVTVDTFESSKASGMIVDGLGTFAGSSLVLKSETTLKVYFEPAAGVAPEDLTFTVDGEAVTAETSGKYLVISITDIKAQELDKVFAVKVSDGNSEGTFNACVFAYCYSVLSDTTGRFSEELKDVVKALYLYNVAADAYF